MSDNGHLGDIGIIGCEPEWEKNVLIMRNNLLNGFYNAIPDSGNFDIEKIVDYEFTEIDDHINVIIDKLKKCIND